MLPNELIDKIFKYRYRDFKIFLSKIKKINREYKEKFCLNDYFELVGKCDIRVSGGPGDFFYNYRRLNSPNHYFTNRVICNPKVMRANSLNVANLKKNY